jgi:hypothetical protein
MLFTSFLVTHPDKSAPPTAEALFVYDPFIAGLIAGAGDLDHKRKDRLSGR